MAISWPLAARAAWPTDPTSALPVCTAPATQQAPIIVLGSGDNSYVAWVDHRSGSLIYAQCISADGTALWGPDGIRVCDFVSPQSHVALAARPQGGAIVAWVDSRVELNSRVYAQLLREDGSRAWHPDGVLVADGDFPLSGLVVVADTSDNSVVLWEEWHSDDWTSWAIVTAQRLGGDGTSVWPAGEVVFEYGWGHQGRVVSDGSGGVIVMVHADGGAESTQMTLQRLDVAGNRRWGAYGLLIGSGHNVESGLTCDGAGGCIVTWTASDYMGYYRYISVQRVDTQGSLLWVPEGVTLCGREGAGIDFPAICSDGSNGAIVAWADSRAGVDDIYAQRVSGSGTPLWTQDGVAVCEAVQSQSQPIATNSGVGAAIILWRDYRANQLDIYAQRLDANGTLAWGASGAPVTTHTTAAEEAVAAYDAKGGALVSWCDNRNGNNDVFAQRINAFGTLGARAPVLWEANGHYYQVVCANATWPEAASAAASMVWNGFAGHLVAITSQAEQDYIYSAFGDTMLTNSCWLGGFQEPWDDPDPAGSWHWITGEAWSYTNWVPNEPNDWNGAPEYYLGVHPYGIPSWNDAGAISSGRFLVEYDDETAGVGDQVSRPERLLRSSAPNPFNPSTTIGFALPAPGRAIVAIYDARGQELGRLVDGSLASGEHRVDWSGVDAAGRPLPSGTYLCRLETPWGVETRKLQLVR